MWTHPGIDVFDELDSRAGLQPAHLIKWNPFLDEAAAVHELESCEDLVIGILDHLLENEPSPSRHASTSLGPPSFHHGETVTGRGRAPARRRSRGAGSRGVSTLSDRPRAASRPARPAVPDPPRSRSGDSA